MWTQFSLAYTGAWAYAYAYTLVKTRLKLLHCLLLFIAPSKGRLHSFSPCMPSKMWSPGHTARRGKEVLCVHEPWLVCVANRPIIITIIEWGWVWRIMEIEEDIYHIYIIFQPYLLVDFPQTFACSVSPHSFKIKTDVFPCSPILYEKWMTFCNTSVPFSQKFTSLNFCLVHSLVCPALQNLADIAL